jgi:hypothetical protein
MNHSKSLVVVPPEEARNGMKVSQRGLLSLAMLLVSVSALTMAFLGGAKLVLDIFGEGLLNALNGMGSKAFVIFIAYAVGWITAVAAIRIYGNLVLPIVIDLFAWACLCGVCILYLLVLQRLYWQVYDMTRYWAYLIIMAAGLTALVGLHLIVEDHDLRPFSIPLLVISLIQLGLIVFRYVFTPAVIAAFLWKDLLFLFAMSAFSISMLAHFGLLAPVRALLKNFFDRHAAAIMSLM